jgi:hypothetical protein
MGAFWKDEPLVGPDWFIFCIITGLVALPIIYFSCLKKEDFWKMFGGFILLTYVLGYFIVIILFIGIGSNIIKLAGILPEEYFDLNKHADFWDKYFFITYGLWYATALFAMCKWARKAD